jgi:peptide/nickel transport system permease protein
VLLLAALAPGLFSALDPIRSDPLKALKPLGTPGHLLGTDYLGRDVWTRLVHGTSPAVWMGAGATLIAMCTGALLGFLAGLGSRRLDNILNGIFDILFSFPDLLLALLLITMLGTGGFNAMLAIGISGIPSFARLMRGEIRRVRNSEFVTSSVALGVPANKIVMRHILPNAVGPVAVLGSLYVGRAVIYGASLSFLGLGAARPTPEWGLMLADAQLYLAMAPWLAIFPGVAITLAAASTVLLARALGRAEK